MGLTDVRTGRGRVVYACFFLLLSLLAVFRAPTYHLWILSIFVTEWGHALAILSLLPFAPGWSQTKGGKAAVALSIASCLIFLTPLMRSIPVARDLPQNMDASLGPSDVISKPFSFKALLLGVPLIPVPQSTHIYARSCGESFLLELYQPPQARQRPSRSPLIVVIHGGSWQSGTRLELSELSRHLASIGYAVASIDYGLAPHTIFPGPVDDVRSALSYLKANAGLLHLDMEKVVLLGRSAGAQIALAAAHEAEPLPGIKGAVIFYGPNDLFLAWRVPGPKRMIDSRKLLRQYLGGSPAEEPERYEQASPLLRAGKGSPPTLMIHGGRDEMVWPLHEYRLSRKLAAAGVPHYFLNMPWATHGCDYNFNGPCGQLSTYAVERFVSFAMR